MAKYIVIGGVAAGAAFAAKISRIDKNAEITMFEKGPQISYANCGLPYYIGSVIEEEASLYLHTPESLKKKFNINALVNVEVISINRDKKTVSARDLQDGKVSEYEYDKIMLAPGGYAIRPPFPGSDLDGVFTLKDVPDTLAVKQFIREYKPKTAVVVGGGFIGIETAENLAGLGIKVSIVEASNQVMQPFDEEMAAILHFHLREKGIDLRLNTKLEAIEKKGGSFSLQLDKGSLSADIVILGIGVRPEIKLAKEAGLLIGDRGGILVDDFLKTSDEDIYAAGDAIEVKNRITGQNMLLALAGNANKQGRIAATNMTGGKETFDGVVANSVAQIFDLTAASVGVNEKVLKGLDIKYDKVYLHPACHANYYPGGSVLHIKVLFEKESGKILGGQIIGAMGVDKRIDVLSTAIYENMTVQDLSKLELAYAPPYSSARDAINYIGDVAQKVVKGDLKQFFWNDCLDFDLNKYFILDVRSEEEYNEGHILKSVNIPLHEVRRRISEIPIDKEICVACFSGHRSYNVVQFLRHKGYKARNLSGGYASWFFAAKDIGVI